MQVYFISGLGADKHAFDRIKLSDKYSVYHIDWLEPLEEETLQHYAQRLIDSVNLSAPFVLVGLSFGGIMSIEINKLVRAKKIILLSSVAYRSQLPWFIRWNSLFKLHKSKLFFYCLKIPKLTSWAFGAKNSILTTYLKARLAATSSRYITWALEQIVHWQQKEKPHNAIQVNGTLDKLFPIKNFHPDYTLAHGSHFMVFTHAEKISEIIEQELSKLEN